MICLSFIQIHLGPNRAELLHTRSVRFPVGQGLYVGFPWTIGPPIWRNIRVSPDVARSTGAKDRIRSDFPIVIVHNQLFVVCCHALLLHLVDQSSQGSRYVMVLLPIIRARKE